MTRPTSVKLRSPRRRLVAPTPKKVVVALTRPLLTRSFAAVRRRQTLAPLIRPAKRFKVKGYKRIAGLVIYWGLLATTNLASTLIKRWATDYRRVVQPRRVRAGVSFKDFLRALERHHKRHYHLAKQRRRGGLKPALLKQALIHIGGFPVRQSSRKHVNRPGLLEGLRHLSRFRRWRSARYFTATMLVILQSFMQGSTVLLGNWLRALLGKAARHSNILYLVEEAGQFFLEDPHSPGYITPYVPSQGFKLRVNGKVDGREIAGAFKAQTGAVRTSNLSAGLNYAYNPIPTSYGVLGLNFWLYVKARVPHWRRGAIYH